MTDPVVARLGDIENSVRSELDAKFAIRELSIKNCRMIIRNSANAIRSLHRGDVTAAQELMGKARLLIDEVDQPLTEHPDVLYAGFYYDAVKEYAEAATTAALLGGDPLPAPDEIGVAVVPYLKGLGEAVGELRRHMLDLLRDGDLPGAEHTFRQMEEIHGTLASLDFPDGMTAGLRRTTDTARALIERSRADLTTTIVQERLRAELSDH